MDEPLKTPLYDVHVEYGARIVAFAGWSMPVQYQGIRQEHIHTRTACSVFDVSHMGRLRLSGPDSESLINRLCTRDLVNAEVGRSYYSHMCRADGGILDDLIVSRFEDQWGIVCNASNRKKIVTWIDKHSKGMNVALSDETVATAMIAIQGPKTLDVIRGLVGAELDSVKRYRFRTLNLMGMSLTVYHSGYTGEFGFEVVVPAGIVQMLLPRLMGTKDSPHPVVKPAGIGARDTLRIEAAMPLYGHELSEEIDPLTAGQGWCVDLSHDFIGAEPLRRLHEGGLPRKLVGLELQGRRIARQHAKLFGGGRVVGEVTSGTLSPTLEKSIAMGFVEREYTDPGSDLEVEVSTQRIAAKVVTLPFYKRPK